MEDYMSLYIYACSAESSTVNGLENEQGKGRTEALYHKLPPACTYQVLTGVDPSSSLDGVALTNSGASHHRERRPFPSIVPPFHASRFPADALPPPS